MNKFYGKVGFYDGDDQIRPGVYRPKIVERTYFGELVRNNIRWENSQHQDNNMSLNQQISILSDAYAHEHWPAIKYIEFNGAKWAVKSVTVGYPRLTLEIGGVYNGINGPSSTP